MNGKLPEVGGGGGGGGVDPYVKVVGKVARQSNENEREYRVRIRVSEKNISFIRYKRSQFITISQTISLVLLLLQNVRLVRHLNRIRLFAVVRNEA